MSVIVLMVVRHEGLVLCLHLALGELLSLQHVSFAVPHSYWIVYVDQPATRQALPLSSIGLVKRVGHACSGKSGIFINVLCHHCDCWPEVRKVAQTTRAVRMVAHGGGAGGEEEEEEEETSPKQVGG